MPREPHNFKPAPAMTFGKKPEMGKKFWWCKKCDTVVKYPSMYSGSDVNRILNASKLICIPPIIGDLAKPL